MTTFKLTALSALAAATLSLGVQAQEVGTYAGGHLGLNNISNWPASVDLGAGVAVDGNLVMDDRWHGGLFIGRQTENARFEVEYVRGNFEVAGARLGPISRMGGGGSGRYQALMFNAYRLYQMNARWGFFAGVGAGIGSTSISGVTPLGTCNCFRDSSGDGLALQARLGSEYRSADGHRLFAQYTWLRLAGPSSGGLPNADFANKNIGAFTIGYRAFF